MGGGDIALGKRRHGFAHEKAITIKSQGGIKGGVMGTPELRMFQKTDASEVIALPSTDPSHSRKCASVTRIFRQPNPETDLVLLQLCVIPRQR